MEEIEDLVGDVQYIDSQKSVTTSNAYSPDFTDSSSDKIRSSSKDTYIIDWDDSDDSDRTFQIRHNSSIINLKNKIEDVTEHKNLVGESINTINRSAGSSLHTCAIVSQEICTQTSKTIFELVANETDFQFARDNRTLQTQTSMLSVTKNQTIEYKLELKGISEDLVNISNTHSNAIEFNDINTNCNNNSQDLSTKYPESETHNETSEEADSESNFSDRIIQFIDAESDENISNKDIDKISNDLESSKYDSDIEEDSLMVNEYHHDKSDRLDSISDTSVPKSVDNDVEELYNKISESIDVFLPEKPLESNLKRYGTLTPLSEEIMSKKESIIDVTPIIKSNVRPVVGDTKKTSFASIASIGSAVSTDNDMRNNEKKFTLPPIHKNKSCPNSPNLNFLFAFNSLKQGNERSFSEQRETLLDRWELCTKNLASGESAVISGRNDSARGTNGPFHLPPINMEGLIQNMDHKVHYFTTSRLNESSKDSSSIQESINIKDKIAELKVTERKSRLATSRGDSPTSTMSPDEAKPCDVAERGSEVLCGELLKKLRSSTWTDVADTLEELPLVLNKFWNVLSETRIADLLRQVVVHVDSPRTQIARLACSTIAGILRNTHYTKKPDFNEAVTTLLTKTGSLSQPVRRAANVALDEIVSGVELSHAVTALCVHGVGHKSALVRCAVVRLLVVCCALAEGGRGLLRGRPPSAAIARRHALRALAVFLDDKNMETRKYAERLYTMLRPLTNFEAYFLTDVDVETAVYQMKRFDQILMRTPNTR